MRPLTEVELHYVDSEEQLARFYDFLARNAGQQIAVDTETTGLQPFGPNRDHVRLVQFGTVDEGWAVPFNEGTKSLIGHALDAFYLHARLVGHNAIFDQSFLQAEGLKTGPAWRCTYLEHCLLHPGSYHGLKAAAAEMVGRECRTGERWLNVVKAKNGWDWASVPLDHPAYWGYSALDTVLTARIAAQLDITPFREQYERKVQVSHLGAGFARHGLRIDMDYTERLVESWRAEQAELLAKLQQHAISNPASSKQLIAALENTGWEPEIFTETGLPQVNRAVLEGIDHEVAGDVLRWRRVNKWAKSYGEPLLNSGGRVHPQVTACLGATGRWSVAAPPIQQIPRGPEVRRCFLPDEGKEFVAVDYDGQELRLIAAFAQDPELTREILAGDVHGKVARVLWGEEYDKEKRSWTKNGIYAYSYGAAEEQMAKTTHRPVGEAEKAIKAALPGMVAFFNNVDKLGRKRRKEDGVAWAKTLGGRKVAAPKSRMYALRNYLMQGSGADILDMALCRIEGAGLADRVLLPVHDELLLQVAPGDSADQEIGRLMETEFRGVPFTTHVSERGQNWGDVA